MPLERVTSIDDPRIAPYRDLPARRSPGGANLFIAEGWLLVQRLLASDYVTKSVLLDERRIERIDRMVLGATPVYVATRALLHDIVGFNFHQGMLACGQRKPTPTLDQVLPPGPQPLVVVLCVDIQDPENLGGILRNCAAFGVDVVIANDHCTDVFSRRVLRVSMGSVLKLAIVHTRQLAADCQRLRDQWNTLIVAAVLNERAIPLQECPRPDRIAIMFGNEATGLAEPWLKACDQQVTIPMQNRVDSLNVAVASGIFLYHFARPCQ